MGTPLYFIKERATGCFGHLRPKKGVFAVIICGIISKLALQIIVNGPGQNYFAKKL
jgi:hypothetical protein